MTKFTSIKAKNSQIWGMDMIIALVIFLFGIITFYLYTINFSNEAGENLDLLFYDGNVIANVLLSEGTPAGWNENNVTSFGLTDQNKINETKLQRFYNIVNSDYNESKKLMNTKFDFYVYFAGQMNINGSMIDGIGKKNVNRTNIIGLENPQNLVKIERFTIYSNKPVQLNIYVWNQELK